MEGQSVPVADGPAPAGDEPERRRRVRASVWGPGVVAVAVLGVAGLDQRDAWLDEACSIAATRQLGRVLTGTSGTMASYYVVLDRWAEVSDSLWWIRLLSVVFAVGAVVALGAVGTRLVGARIARWACLFLGLSWMMVRYAQEARSFAMVVLVVALAWWALDRVVADPLDRRWVVAHVGLCVLVPLTHGLGVLAVLVQVGALLAGGVGRRVWSAALPGIVAGAGTAGGLYLLGASEVGSHADPLSASQVGRLLRQAHGAVSLDRLPVPVWVLLLSVTLYGTVVALARAVRAAPGPDRFRAVAAPVWGLGTIGALVLLSVVRPSMVERYAIGAIPAIALLQAIAACDVQDRLRRLPPLAPLLGALPLVPLAVVALLAVGQVRLQDDRLTSWSDLVATVDAEAEPGDGLLVPSVARMALDAAWAELDDPPDVASVGRDHPLGTVQRYGTGVRGLELTDDALAVTRLWVVERVGAGGDDPAYEGFRSRPLIVAGFEEVSERRFGYLRLHLLVNTSRG